MDDLVVRLRDCEESNRFLGFLHLADLLREAADEIVRLRGERVGYEEALHGSQGANAELRAEVERLRLQLAWRTERAAPFHLDLAALEVEEGHPDAPDECPGHGRGGTRPACCERAGTYNGFGSDGPRLFTCPEGCSCHG